MFTYISFVSYTRLGVSVELALGHSLSSSSSSYQFYWMSTSIRCSTKHSDSYRYKWNTALTLGRAFPLSRVKETKFHWVDLGTGLRLWHKLAHESLLENFSPQLYWDIIDLEN